MRGLYSSPIRVYLALAALALGGIIAGTRLPVSLFPNASKPSVSVRVPYGSLNAREFIQTYGENLEGLFRALNTDAVHVSKVTATHGDRDVRYTVEFNWGDSPTAAQREVSNVVTAFASRFPSEMRDATWTWTNADNSGFLAVSFFSPKRDIDEIYKIVDPILTPRIAKVQDANQAVIWNPTRFEISVELIPEKMAALKLFPRDVDNAINAALEGYSGGSVLVDTSQLSVQMPRRASSIDDLGRVPVLTPSGEMVHLSDIARIDLAPKTTDTQTFKTSGAPSVLLFATPKAGGNVKRMSEDLLEIVREAKASGALPADIDYRNLVDPSEFIRSAVKNVFHEVIVGALLAVAILFLFIGSLKNTITAAIEIPMSMVLAFILMRLSGMNLNLISLGGLALSAGMNVDASVVVMENIFRHFDELTPEQRRALTFNAKLERVVAAVKEVRFPVIASTVASLVVFLPLAFTSDLTNGILGDLAKTVVFSHGFSMFVALILVPTVRLHLLAKGAETPHHAPIEGAIRWLEDRYARWLGVFLRRPRLQLASYAGLSVVLVALMALVLPSLPREVVGKPDTDFLEVGVNTSGNNSMRQMEGIAGDVEAKLMNQFGSHFLYTFAQIRTNSAWVTAKLADKSEMRQVRKQMEAFFQNTPDTNYDVGSWNPAELPIPDPPKMRLVIRGGENRDRARVARDLMNDFYEKDIFPSLWSVPGSSPNDVVSIKPNPELLGRLHAERGIGAAELADLARVATQGRKVARMNVDSRDIDVVIRYPENQLTATEDLEGLPIGLGGKIVPLKALATVSREEADPEIFREDGSEQFSLYGRQDEENRSKGPASLLAAQKRLEEWKKTPAGEEVAKAGVSMAFEDSEKELTDALRQLGIAVGLSVLLIFLTLVFQFGDVVNALLVLVAVPLGLIGVLTSLFVFRSTLSLNSVLGVILLNGIAVANSIILVDFLKKRVGEGLSPAEAAIDAGRKRLRPILITSLTTILGMLPIALGMGEGGRILQPLGIAVSGGLWISMVLTLFVAPALQVAYLQRRERRELIRTLMIASGEIPRPGLRLPFTSKSASCETRISS